MKAVNGANFIVYGDVSFDIDEAIIDCNKVVLGGERFRVSTSNESGTIGFQTRDVVWLTRPGTRNGQPYVTIYSAECAAGECMTFNWNGDRDNASRVTLLHSSETSGITFTNNIAKLYDDCGIGDMNLSGQYHLSP